MEIIEKQIDNQGTAVALGNFDGLHIAHLEIIKNAVKYARANDLKSGVLLFEKNTNIVIGKKTDIITSNREKIDIIKNAEVDFVFFENFDDDFMKKTPQEFAEYLVKKLNVKAVFIGYDYTFGHKAAGNVELLKELGTQYGFKVFVTNPVSFDGEIVSSTSIRKYIKSGITEKVTSMLGRYYSICGKVATGLQNGRKMHFPTANVECDLNTLLPSDGVYVGITAINGSRYRSIINVGRNLTFDAKRKTVESHIIDFDDDIYGENIRIEFIKKLRDVIKFDNINDLKEQINFDKKRAVKLFTEIEL